MFYQRFIQLCEIKGTKPSSVAKQLGLASGSPTAWKNGTVPDREALVKIGDYFDCSIDYLLGRTDNPEAHKSTNVVYGNLSNNNNIFGNVGSTINTTAQNGQCAALVDIFNGLDPIKQAKLLVYADSLKSE